MAGETCVAGHCMEPEFLALVIGSLVLARAEKDKGLRELRRARDILRDMGGQPLITGKTMDLLAFERAVRRADDMLAAWERQAIEFREEAA